MGWWAAAVVGRSGSGPSSRRSGFGVRAGARTGSGCRPEFRAPAFEGEEGVRDRDERDVVMPAAVGAALEVVQAERVFEFAVVVLDAPAELAEPNQLTQWRVGGQAGEPVVGRFFGAGGPFGQQPADGQFGLGI